MREADDLARLTFDLGSVFEKCEINVSIARLCVLYEDLRIELYGMCEPRIERLDIIDGYRRDYFLRRSICTLCEFAEELRLLDKRSEFTEVEATFDGKAEQLWKEAIDFFRAKEPLIQKVRNDIGGHFGHKAADWAIQNLRPNTVGAIELQYDNADLQPVLRLPFAKEIAGTALLRHLSGSSDEEKINPFFKEVLNKGWLHVGVCTQLLVTFIYPRFEMMSCSKSS